MQSTLEQLATLSPFAVQIILAMFIVICMLTVVLGALLIYCQGLDEENIKYRARDNKLIEKGSWL